MAMLGLPPGLPNEAPSWSFPSSLSIAKDISPSPFNSSHRLSIPHSPLPDSPSTYPKTTTGDDADKHPVFASIAQAPPSSLVVPAPAPETDHASKSRRKARRKKYIKVSLRSDSGAEVPQVPTVRNKLHQLPHNRDAVFINPTLPDEASAHDNSLLSTARPPVPQPQPPSSKLPPTTNNSPSYVQDLKQLAEPSAAKNPRRKSRRRQGKDMTINSIPPHLRYANRNTNANAIPKPTLAVANGVTTTTTNGATAAPNGKTATTNGKTTATNGKTTATNGKTAATNGKTAATNGATTTPATILPYSLKLSPYGPVPANHRARTWMKPPNYAPRTNVESKGPVNGTTSSSQTKSPPAKSDLDQSGQGSTGSVKKPLAHVPKQDGLKQTQPITPIGWDTPISALPPLVFNGNKRANFAKDSDIRAASNSRNRRWPTNKEMRAPLHKSESVESYKSESDGDPDHDIRKLTDWEGKWLPAPVEWEGRRGFSDKNSYQTIDAWVTRTVKACRDIIDVTAAEFKAHENGDIAPRSWIPLAIEAESPQGFWRTLQSRAPAALSDIGPEEMPWWEKYISPLGDHMAHINQPHSIMERQDPGYAPCQRDDGSVGASKRHLQIKNQKYEKAAEKRKRQMEASAEAIATYGEIPEPPDTRLKPTANIFVRPANVTDMDQVKEIYNHYVRHTIHSPEYNPRAQAHMVTRMTDILNAKLPFLVAVDRSSKGNKNGEVGQITHRIVGFADADDYCHPGSMYRFTVELELFVHPDYLRKGIGSCLLDKMLSLLDNGRAALGGYDWIAPRTYGTDGMRVVKSVNVNLPYDSRNRQSSERTEEWLYKFGFKARGRLENMGYKNNTVVNLAIYQFITTEWIDPRQWPSNPL